MTDKLLNRHVFCFNENDNGGESLILKTEFFDNGDKAAGLPYGVYTNQTLTLQSYCNSATFNFNFYLTPETLRKLADELEEAEKEANN